MPKYIAITKTVLVALVVLFSAACARKDVHRDGSIKLRGEKPVEVTRKQNGELLQRGQASWYGHPYHGRKTSSGETYDMELKTAAHKTLPFGTVVKVVDEATGLSVLVRINDRGPFVRGRIIDLSRSAARDLDLVRRGTTEVSIYLASPEDLAKAETQVPPPRTASVEPRREAASEKPRDLPPEKPREVAVEKPHPAPPPKPKSGQPKSKPSRSGTEVESVPVIYAPDEIIEEEILEPGAELPNPRSAPQGESRPRSKPPTGSAWTVQVGSFTTRDRAEAVVLQMRTYADEVGMVEQDGLFKVRAGKFTNRAEAQALAERLEADAISTWITRW